MQSRVTLFLVLLLGLLVGGGAFTVHDAEGGTYPGDDPNQPAARQEMRSFVCGQRHAEYDCSDKFRLTFPWAKGLTVENAAGYARQGPAAAVKAKVGAGQ